MLKQKLHFYKYQGAGNDFILIDNRKLIYNHSEPKKLASLCDRRFGVGSDGIIFLELMEGFDFRMVYYNADGQTSSMCGNGGRCIVAFAKELGIIKNETSFLAVDGPHSAKISGEGDWVSLKMIDVDVVKRDGEAFVLNTGSPHYVQFCSNIAEKEVLQQGRAIRNNSIYQNEGINVNFAEDKGDHILVRTYERGVEDETLACGTGVTAVAIAHSLANQRQGAIETSIKAVGGDLDIRFDSDGKKFTNIYLEGPAVAVFEGDILF